MGTVQNKPILHGRDHATNGPDPIPGMSGGGIAFDTDNEGGWLYVQTNDETEAGGSIHGLGLELKDVSAGGIWIHTFAGLSLEASTTLGLLSHSDIVTVQSDMTTTYPAYAVLIQALTGTVSITADGFHAQAGGVTATLDLTPSGGAGLVGDAGASITSGTLIELNTGGDIKFTGLPTSNPGGAGLVWNDSGTLKIT